METVEERAKQKARRGQLKSAILEIVAVGGIFTLAVVAPNAVRAIPRSVLKLITDRPRSARDSAVSRLIAQGYIVREAHGAHRVLRITDKGRRYLDLHKQRSRPVIPRRWDKRWRVVMFDITEKHRALRNTLRRELVAYGFVMLQASVWVYPYPCEEFIVLLKSDNRIGKRMLYLVVEELENDRGLREHFGLDRT